MKKTLQTFFAKGLAYSDHPLFSHQIRWDNTARNKTFFSDDLNHDIGDYDGPREVMQTLPEDFYKWDTLSKAQYPESSIFLSNYLLSSQGDRVAMANSLEIRLPYLDYRIMEFTAKMPSKWKILGLKEKYLLKQLFKHQLPECIVARNKHPYRAPIWQSLMNNNPLILELLSEPSLEDSGLFDPQKVQRLIDKLQQNTAAGEIDDMALVGIISSQCIHHMFIKNRPQPKVANINITVYIDKRTNQ